MLNKEELTIEVKLEGMQKIKEELKEIAKEFEKEDDNELLDKIKNSISGIMTLIDKICEISNHNRIVSHETIKDLSSLIDDTSNLCHQYILMKMISKITN